MGKGGEGVKGQDDVVGEKSEPCTGRQGKSGPWCLPCPFTWQGGACLRLRGRRVRDARAEVQAGEGH